VKPSDSRKGKYIEWREINGKERDGENINFVA
jgi:hypothetical protein